MSDTTTLLVQEMAALRAELAALRARLEGLEQAMTPARPVPREREVVVGGQTYRIRPLSPKAVLALTGELPGLLFVYLSSGGKPQPPDEVAELLYQKSKEYLAASGVPQEALEDLTFFEARDALKTIVEVNGIDLELARFFREQGKRLSAGPGSQEVRGEAVQSPGGN